MLVVRLHLGAFLSSSCSATYNFIALQLNTLLRSPVTKILQNMGLHKQTWGSAQAKTDPLNDKTSQHMRRHDETCVASQSADWESGGRVFTLLRRNVNEPNL